MKILGIILLVISLIYGVRAAIIGLPAFGFDYWLCITAVFVSIQVILHN